MDRRGTGDTPNLQKSPRFLRAAGAIFALLIVAAVSMYAWYSIYRPCDAEAVEKVSTRLITQLKWYDEAYQFATSASPTALVRPVNTLQQILMDTKQITVPACMQTAKDELINYMGTVIRAFLAFGPGEPDAAVRDLIEQSNTHYGNFSAEMDAVKECAPFCFPYSLPERDFKHDRNAPNVGCQARPFSFATQQRNIIQLISTFLKGEENGPF